jgi:hypothetical protein
MMTVNLRAKIFESPASIVLISVITGFAIYMATQQLRNGAVGGWLYFIPIGVLALIIELREPWSISIENENVKILWLFGAVSKDFNLSSIDIGARAFMWPAILFRFTNGGSLKIRKKGYSGVENLDVSSLISKST